MNTVLFPELFSLALSAFWFVVIANTLFWVGLWQVKEYRLDRLSAHLTETLQGRRVLFSLFTIIKWIVCFGYAAVVVNKELFPLYQLTVTVVFLLETLRLFRAVVARKMKRPVFTLKSALLVLLTLALIFFTLQFPLLESIFMLVVLERLTPLLISCFVFLLTFPTEVYWDLQIEKAIKILRSHKNLLVIGVTGSYGKSSTKEYIAQILSKKFVVLKTPGSNNTPIGIAKTVTGGLTKATEVLVVEMGAYKKKEIAMLASIVRPKIGVIAGISDQHLSLFGSMKNISSAKYELIEALPKNGLALFNGNSEGARALFGKTKVKKVLYQTFRAAPQYPLDIAAYNIRAGKTLVSFDVLLRGTSLHLQAPLLGRHSVENVMPGVYLANSLGMTVLEIREAVSTLSPPKETMIRYRLFHGLSVIDDSFSANPDAVMAALQYMKVYEGKKILVLQPLIELGRKAQREHYEVGREAGKICDYLFLTNSNFFSHVLRGVRDGGGKCMVKVARTDEIVVFMKEVVEEGDVAVFEGREAGLVLRRLL